MKKQILLASLAAIACGGLQEAAAQNRCGTQVILDRIVSHPEQLEKLRQLQLQQETDAAAYAEKARSNPFMKTTNQVTIPVVFHILLNQGQINGIGGISGIEQRIDSQITVLNRDYNGANPDKGNIPSAFLPFYANMEIKFGLARTNPSGHGTVGYEIVTLPATTKFIDIDGTQGSTQGFSDAKYTNGSPNAWDPKKYLNIWVINASVNSGDTSSLLGMGIPPSFLSFGLPEEELGVVLNYRAWGKRKNLSDKYIAGIDGGRTLTHELGHFFELQHPWGSMENECSEDDGIADTPPSYAPSYSPSASSCQTFPQTNTCSPSSPGIMFMNFMDYSNDKCLLMFTAGQKNLARAQFDNSNDYTYSLTQHPELLFWPQSVGETEVAASIVVAPNPTGGNFSISFGKAPRNLNGIMVRNTVGQVIRQVDVKGNNNGIYNVDLSGMSKGVYFVQCLFDGTSKTEKIVLQ